MTGRLNHLTERLPQLQCDAFLVTDEINVRYLTGFTGDSSSLLVTGDGATMVSDGRYKRQLDEECPELTLAIRTPTQRPLDLLVEVIDGCGADRVGVEADQMTAAMLSGLKQRLPAVEFVETTTVIESLRAIKDNAEIEIIRRSIRINERALESVLAKLTPDWTEIEMVYELEATIRRLGAQGFSFPPIIGAGPGGAKPHYQSGPVTIGHHRSLLVDWGTMLGGYASDMTRTFHFGNPPDRFDGAYRAVLESQLAAIDRIAPGVTGREVDAAARESLKNAGLDRYFVHGLGHGVGLRVHESPRLSVVSEDRLQPGMIITVEPGVYFEDDFGIRIEDDVLVTEDGHEVLSRTPKGLDDCALML